MGERMLGRYIRVEGERQRERAVNDESDRQP